MDGGRYVYHFCYHRVTGKEAEGLILRAKVVSVCNSDVEQGQEEETHTMKPYVYSNFSKSFSYVNSFLPSVFASAYTLSISSNTLS